MVNVIGLGYIGLPTALMLATHGIHVVGSDINEKVIQTLESGRVHFQEEGLEDLYGKARERGIRFTRDYQATDCYIIAVPTPYQNQTKKMDPAYVIQALNSVLDVCHPGAVIIIESTVSPGTIDRYLRPELAIRGMKAGVDVHLVHAPERIIPGRMLHELVHNARTIGADDPEIAKRVADLYRTFCQGEIVLTDIRSAEMSKVVENTFRDVNIAYANELAKICRADGMDVYEIIRIANQHPRVNILQPGPGVGGHCISVDPWFLVGDYPDLTNLILTARKINDSMPGHVLKRIHDIMKEHDIRDVTRVGLYGLTYKENVDDTRESPTLQLLERMEEHLAFGIRVFDPWIKENIVEHQMQDFTEFINSIDLLVIMVGHDHLQQHSDAIQDKIILDTRNVWSGKGVYKL